MESELNLASDMVAARLSEHVLGHTNDPEVNGVMRGLTEVLGLMNVFDRRGNLTTLRDDIVRLRNKDTRNKLKVEAVFKLVLLDKGEQHGAL